MIDNARQQMNTVLKMKTFSVMCFRTLTKLSLAMSLSLASFDSFAHYPFCHCKMEAEQIHCEGGFSDGSGAEGVIVDLISYDEEIIYHQTFDKSSETRFKPYDGEFYILLDAGPGHTIEVDWTEIEGFTR